MNEDELKINVRTSDDQKLSMIDIKIPPECVMRDKHGNVFIDPDFMKMINDSMVSGGFSEYGMSFKELKDEVAPKKLKRKAR